MFKDFGFSELSSLKPPQFIPNLDIKQGKDTVTVCVKLEEIWTSTSFRTSKLGSLSQEAPLL